MDYISGKIEQLLPKKKLKVIGEDFLMQSVIPYYILASLMMMAQFGATESPYFFIWVIFAIIPLIDQFASLDLKNPTENERKQLENRDIFFKMALYVTIIFDWALFFKIIGIFSQVNLTVLDLVKTVSFMFIFANLNAVQFAVSHEIFHKQGKFNKYLGTIHMIKNLYMHFTYQHLYGHHKRVATPQDPASAQKGINTYQFFPRTFFGSYVSVYEMQKQEKKPFYLNYAVLSVLASILFTIFVFKYFGTQGGIFFLLQSLGSVFILETINYIEHYGLQRQKLPNGQYEKVTIRHSWNAPHRFTNYLLFKLQRHSDHHENSMKPYQTLVTLEQSPHLPHGYTVCIIMAFFPSTWFRIMDPLVDEYNKTKKGNIDGEVMRTAVKETRKFIIKLFLVTTFLYGASLVYT